MIYFIKFSTIESLQVSSERVQDPYPPTSFEVPGAADKVELFYQKFLETGIHTEYFSFPGLQTENHSPTVTNMRGWGQRGVT